MELNCRMIQPIVYCERLFFTIGFRIILNHIKLLGGWSKDLDWSQQIKIIRIGIRKKQGIERN